MINSHSDSVAQHRFHSVLNSDIREQQKKGTGADVLRCTIFALFSLPRKRRQHQESHLKNIGAPSRRHQLLADLSFFVLISGVMFKA